MNASHHKTHLKPLIDIFQAYDGCLTFANYMQQVLYAPGWGYYSSGKQKIGAEGDFVTAPELSPLFSQCLAHQCQQILSQIPNGDILEFGAGRGTMAADILLQLEKNQQLPKHYYILELSASLRAEQKQTLAQRCPKLSTKVKWLDCLPEQDFTGVILANEVLDAMPVHVVHFEKDLVFEKVVTLSAQQLHWDHIDITCPQLKQHVEKIRPYLSDENNACGYTTEINLQLSPWIKSLDNCLLQGSILLIDYGFPRHEYYHPSRHQGTLMCHYQHRSHADPLCYPSLQDITAHVDFTHIAEATENTDLTVCGYTDQATFLIGCGLMDLIPDSIEPRQQLEIAQQIKYLTLPSEMGELFKVIALNKNFNEALLGFTMGDKQHRL